MNDNKLNVGFIGAGFIGQIAHINNFAQVNNCTMYALAERRPKLRKLVGDRYSIPNLYEHHSQLLDDPKLDAVVIVVPRPYTASVALECLKAGKHVFSEKPMAGNYEQGRELVEAARDNEVRYCVGYMKRYDKGVLKTKSFLNELLQSEELGKLLHVRGYCYMGDSYCNASGHIVTDEPVDYSFPQGAIAPYGFSPQDSQIFARYVNVYSHLTNLFSFFFEKEPEVEYFKYIHSTAHTCVLNYDNFLATLETGESSKREWDEGVEFHFENGKLSIQLPPALLMQVPAKVVLYKGGGIQEVVQPLCDWSWAFREQASEFVNDVLNNLPSVIDCSYALQDLNLIEKIWSKRS